jgi:CheY-like chemotaxis protein
LRTSKKNILYVEDDKTSRYVIKKALSNFYDVDTAKNAEEAISKLNVNGFDAILMDINLGQKPDGLELTKIIRDMNGCDTIPIIAVTAYASSEDKKEFLQKGLNYYIAKPFSMKELFNLLGKVFAV